jgi:hypothetical protein
MLDEVQQHKYFRPARGQSCVYHVGTLHIGSLTGSFRADGTGNGFVVQDPRSVDAAPRAMAARADYEAGHVVLAQRRISETQHEFIAIGI